MIYKKLLTTLLILSVTTFIQASEIKMMTENYPPYNMEVDGKLQGLSVDVVEAMLKQMGSKKNKYDIELLSWSKAYDSAKNNKNNMVFSTTRTKSREKSFKWVGPITKTTIGITALKNRNIVIKNISDLKKYKIGCIKKDIGESLLIENKIPKENLVSIDGTNSLATTFYKLERDKIDMFAYETKVANYSADLNGFDSDEYEVVYTLSNGELYFAFNRLTSDKTIQKWQKALDKIKANGIYQEIIKKY
jgi:polar amino acid transport system substrate-binding protein